MSEIASKYIALFRGINVGGKNALPMKALTGIVEAQGYTGVRSYIQSGNVVFESTQAKAETFPKDIGDAIMREYGFCPDIHIMSAKALKKAVDKNPFSMAEAEPNSLHLFFLADTPKHPDLDALQQIKTDSESFKLIGSVFYLHAPDGVGRSKLAAQAEKRLGASATARNWNTVTRLLEMV